MSDMTEVTKAKTDQLNYDDIIGKTITIKITDVVIKAGEQPVTVKFEGDNGKPYKPCKSMCRVMVHLWGKDSKTYVGKSMTLYGDPSVKFGGLAVGGIRISHMSGINEAQTMALTVTKANKKPFTVKPLQTNAAPVQQTTQTPASSAVTEHDKTAKRISLAINASENAADLDALWNVDYKDDLDKLREEKPDYYTRLKAQADAKLAEWNAT